jgi:hypothetical protein
MQFTITDRYACGIDRFWAEIFFSPAYNERLYLDGLRFPRFEVVRQASGASGALERVIRVMPRLDAPAPVRKLIGEALVYEEHGCFDPAGRHFLTRIVPSRLADKLTLTADMWLEPVGPEASDRVVQFTVEARVFGLGALMERFIERTLRENYGLAARFTNAWLQAPSPEGAR